MSQQPPNDENNYPGEASNPDVPPEYLTNDAPSFPSQNSWQSEVPPAEPNPDVPAEYLPHDLPTQDSWQAEIPAAGSTVESATPVSNPDVPPEYLASGAETYPAASQQQPLPDAGVPHEYLGSTPLPAQPAGIPPAYSGGGVPAYTGAAIKDRSIAILLEVVPGLFGFLGIGWIYAGNIAVGLGVLVAYLVFIGIEILLAVVSVGFACCCTLPINIAAIAVSTLLLNNYIEQRPGQFNK